MFIIIASFFLLSLIVMSHFMCYTGISVLIIVRIIITIMMMMMMMMIMMTYREAALGVFSFDPAAFFVFGVAFGVVGVFLADGTLMDLSSKTSCNKHHIILYHTRIIVNYRPLILRQVLYYTRTWYYIVDLSSCEKTGTVL
jgi:hypothetical protein